eukprot:COSAG06_NODE_5148_length_3679_cov_9.779050_2_plen_85_part_00
MTENVNVNVKAFVFVIMLRICTALNFTRLIEHCLSVQTLHALPSIDRSLHGEAVPRIRKILRDLKVGCDSGAAAKDGHENDAGP